MGATFVALFRQNLALEPQPLLVQAATFKPATLQGSEYHQPQATLHAPEAETTLPTATMYTSAKDGIYGGAAYVAGGAKTIFNHGVATAKNGIDYAAPILIDYGVAKAKRKIDEVIPKIIDYGVGKIIGGNDRRRLLHDIVKNKSRVSTGAQMPSTVQMRLCNSEMRHG